MGLLPAASRTKRLLWALMGGYGLFLQAALMHRQQLWAAETSTSSGAPISGSSGTGSGDSAFTSLVSRTLLRKQSDEPQQQQQPGGVQPQYEVQALHVNKEGSSEQQQPIWEEEASAAAAAAASIEPPITSPASAFWQAEEAYLRGQPDYAAAVATNSTRPIRTAGEMGRAQECFRKGEGYAYLVHMRKAGGEFWSMLVDGG